MIVVFQQNYGQICGFQVSVIFLEKIKKKLKKTCIATYYNFIAITFFTKTQHCYLQGYKQMQQCQQNSYVCKMVLCQQLRRIINNYEIFCVINNIVVLSFREIWTPIINSLLKQGFKFLVFLPPFLTWQISGGFVEIVRKFTICSDNNNNYNQNNKSFYYRSRKNGL
eukprot:TRINITY_DN4387_c0_g1_i5.p10 TRINITY_DN4387_c0_g1~~TRINITY_DN4387_c0_g1_i5.p10  ORF type:complete len:167 (-),score=1.49 TRINITY_DN4387_c0_g1_i5:1191-1691(-)